MLADVSKELPDDGKSKRLSDAGKKIHLTA
jgi:hypothetical protein